MEPLKQQAESLYPDRPELQEAYMKGFNNAIMTFMWPYALNHEKQHTEEKLNESCHHIINLLKGGDDDYMKREYDAMMNILNK